MWMPHWGLSRDPFAELESPYVSLPSHDEAVARPCLRGRNCASSGLVLAAPAGLGKTAVLRKALWPHASIRGVALRFGELPAERNPLVHACLPSGWGNVSAASRAGSGPGGPSNARSAWQRSGFSGRHDHR